MSIQYQSHSPHTYRARRPELTDWYQVINDELSTLEKVAERGPIEGRGYLRPEVLGTFEALLECGLPHFGLARFHCDGCGKDVFVALSCRRRGLCHSCHAYRQEKLVQYLLDEVLPLVPYCQWVISFPKRIRPFFRYDPNLNKAVSRIVADVIQTYIRKSLGEQQLEAGVIAFDQSFGALLGYHPHQHMLSSCGGFLRDGRFVELGTIKESHVILLEEVLRRRILLLLQRRHRIDRETRQSMLTWRHSGFSLDVSSPIAAHERQGLERLIRYQYRHSFEPAGVLYNKQNRTVVYRQRKEHPKKHRNSEVFSTQDFLLALADQVPHRRKHLVRYYGAAHHKVRKRLCIGPDNPTVFTSSVGPPQSQWARLLYREFGLQPLKCQCGNTLRLMAVIFSFGDLQRILRHLGQPTQPPARASSRKLALKVTTNSVVVDENVDPPFVDDVPEYRGQDLLDPWH